MSRSDRPLPTIPEPHAGEAAEHAARSVGRYQYGRRLGEGGMGVVYLARDRETGEQVAIKTLRRLDTRSVLRLKREFRALADIDHPNLVKMYELSSDDNGWYVAMEYLDGQELWEYLELGDQQTDDDPWSTAPTTLVTTEMPAHGAVIPMFYQLAAGIAALHAAGLLHRDLKPSNVMVCDHRVVVLDFGLVRGLDSLRGPLTHEEGIAGTPEYMSPEQVQGEDLTAGSDWYAFGVMLYEALTGDLPYCGTAFEMMHAKLTDAPEPPADLSADVPKQLSALCMQLLERNPAARPAGAEVLTTLKTIGGLESAAPTPLSPPERSPRHVQLAPLFGRQREMRTLRDALGAAGRGDAVVVRVTGAAGVGKSALLERFLDDLEAEAPADDWEPVVLRSQCHEQEAIPFKALDGVVDALTRHLLQLPDVLVGNLLPRGVSDLARVFPIVERLPAVQQLTRLTSAGGDDVLSARRHAEQALEELLRRLSTRQLVVIWIDDLQWGDLDSARVLGRWLHQLTDHRLLVLLSYRSSEAQTSAALRALLKAEQEPDVCAVQTLEVGPLAHAEIEALCRARLKIAPELEAQLTPRIVSESHGNPFLAKQLISLAEARTPRLDGTLPSITIEHLLEEAVALLSEDGEQLLATLAAAGRPVPAPLALRAADVQRGRETVRALRRLRLVRSAGGIHERLLDVYHDRIREGVLRRLDPTRLQRLYARLWHELTIADSADAEWLHRLALGAGERNGAVCYGMEAADRAAKALAFERAVDLYTRCLELSDQLNTHEQVQVRARLADALGYCGRALEAADAYQQAAELADEQERVRFLHLASSHLYRCGHFERADELLHHLLVRMDLRPPRTRPGMFAAIAWHLLRLSIGGLRFPRKTEAEIPPAVLARIDMVTTIYQDAATFAPRRAIYFLLRKLAWLRDAGESRRVLVALCSVYFLLVSGPAFLYRRAEQVLTRVHELVGEIGTSAAEGFAMLVQAYVHWTLGRDERAIARSIEAENHYRAVNASRLHGSYFFRLGAVAVRVGSRINLGDFATADAELRSALREAEQSDNRAMQMVNAVNQARLDMVAGRLDGVVARLEQQRARLPTCEEHSRLHSLHMIAVCDAACATGQVDWGMRCLAEDWPRFSKSMERRIPIIAVLAFASRAQLVMNHHAAHGAPGARVPRAADESIRALERAYLKKKALPLSLLLRARLLIFREQRSEARALLRQAADCAVEPAVAAQADYACGVLQGGESGERMASAAIENLANLGVKNPTHYLRSFFPELFNDG